jgi:hypothetical protein
MSQIYFGNETLHVSDSSSVHHQELFTVHSAMVYVIQVCRQLSSRIRMEVPYSSSVHHQELFTVHLAMVYVIRVCRQLSSRIRMEVLYSSSVHHQELFTVHLAMVYVIQAIDLHPKVHYEYFIFCSCILGISQLDLPFPLSVVHREFEP